MTWDRALTTLSRGAAVSRRIIHYSWGVALRELAKMPNRCHTLRASYMRTARLHLATPAVPTPEKIVKKYKYREPHTHA